MERELCICPKIDCQYLKNCMHKEIHYRTGYCRRRCRYYPNQKMVCKKVDKDFIDQLRLYEEI